MDQNEYATYKVEVDKWLDNANKLIDKCNNIKNVDEIDAHLNEMNVSLTLTNDNCRCSNTKHISLTLKTFRFCRVEFLKLKK